MRNGISGKKDIYLQKSAKQQKMHKNHICTAKNYTFHHQIAYKNDHFLLFQLTASMKDRLQFPKKEKKKLPPILSSLYADLRIQDCQHSNKTTNYLTGWYNPISKQEQEHHIPIPKAGKPRNPPQQKSSKIPTFAQENAKKNMHAPDRQRFLQVVHGI